MAAIVLVGVVATVVVYNEQQVGVVVLVVVGILVLPLRVVVEVQVVGLLVVAVVLVVAVLVVAGSSSRMSRQSVVGTRQLY